MKILLVEDSATIRYATCKYIEESGHTTIVAENGESALQILDTTPVDMVIMDVEMPGLDGFETTRLIREWLGDHWIPIIFVTGKSEAASLEEGIAAGGDDYLIKPVNQTILNAKIRAMERITEMRNELSKLNEELMELSQRDGLTNLYNRRTFEEKAQEVWQQAARTNSPLSILLMDIDHFKLFNDCYGHPAGDECIRKVAQVLKSSVGRSSDVVARYGGEEFVALLSNTNIEGARHICERLREGVENLQVRHRDSSVSKVVTMSIGASTISAPGATSLQEQVALADKALYESKMEGRNKSTIRPFSVKARVLIVDENEDSLGALHDALRTPFLVITSSQASESMSLADEYFPDVIVYSLNQSPAEDEYLSKLGEHAENKSIPMIVINGVDDDKDKIKAISGADEVLPPSAGSALLATTVKKLSKRSASD